MSRLDCIFNFELRKGWNMKTVKEAYLNVDTLTVFYKKHAVKKIERYDDDLFFVQYYIGRYNGPVLTKTNAVFLTGDTKLQTKV